MFTVDYIKIILSFSHWLASVIESNPFAVIAKVCISCQQLSWNIEDKLFIRKSSPSKHLKLETLA